VAKRAGRAYAEHHRPGRHHHRHQRSVPRCCCHRHRKQFCWYGLFSVDLLVDTSLAAQGLQIMAISGVFSGQMFNFMVGFSLSSILRAFRSSKKQTFQLFDWSRPSTATNYMLILVFGSLLFNLIYLYFKIKINKYPPLT
jgi:hypothetical protein